MLIIAQPSNNTVGGFTNLPPMVGQDFFKLRQVDVSPVRFDFLLDDVDVAVFIPRIADGAD